MMKHNRRSLLALSLGAAQYGLLARFGLDRARAGGARPQGPTKLLSIWLDGGCQWETFFTPMSGEGINRLIPPPQGGIRPSGYDTSMVHNFDGSLPDLGSTDPVRPLSGPIYWNWDDPADESGVNPLGGGVTNFRPWGYGFANPSYALYDRTVLLAGVDQGTAAHPSGRIAGACGVAGPAFRAPAIAAVVANHMAQFFPDRPLPSVVLGGPEPRSLNLPATAGPTQLSSPTSVVPMLSESRDSAWAGLRTREETPELGFDGTDLGTTVPLTAVDAALRRALRSERGLSTSGTDQLLEQLYDNYAISSKLLARDVTTLLAGTPSWEHLADDPGYPVNWSACIGTSDLCGMGADTGPYGFALQLLKSDLVTSVSMRATSIGNQAFDRHATNGYRLGGSHLHIALEAVARMCLEMSLTPSASDPGRSLLDETLVYVYSDFGRGFSASIPPASGTDHQPTTCALLMGGNLIGNQMIGGYDDQTMANPTGIPVPIIEEGGESTLRTPRAQDVAASIYHAFGLRSGEDFFIPGGYGHFAGIGES